MEEISVVDRKELNFVGSTAPKDLIIVTVVVVAEMVSILEEVGDVMVLVAEEEGIVIVIRHHEGDFRTAIMKMMLGKHG